MTRAEAKILAYVRECNAQGALAGLRTAPTEDTFEYNENRFVRRLFKAGHICYVSHVRLGSGWATPEAAETILATTRA